MEDFGGPLDVALVPQVAQIARDGVLLRDAKVAPGQPPTTLELDIRRYLARIADGLWKMVLFVPGE